MTLLVEQSSERPLSKSEVETTAKAVENYNRVTTLREVLGVPIDEDVQEAKSAITASAIEAAQPTSRGYEDDPIIKKARYEINRSINNGMAANLSSANYSLGDTIGSELFINANNSISTNAALRATQVLNQLSGMVANTTRSEFDAQAKTTEAFRSVEIVSGSDKGTADGQAIHRAALEATGLTPDQVNNSVPFIETAQNQGWSRHEKEIATNIPGVYYTEILDVAPSDSGKESVRTEKFIVKSFDEMVE